MTLSADNRAILERSIARGKAMVAADPVLARSTPALDTFQRAVEAPTSIAIVEKICSTYADRPALGYRAREGDRLLPAFATLSYRALWERVARLASGLVHTDLVRTGDIVIIIGSSTVDHVVVELALHYLAAVSVPLARGVPDGELRAVVQQCESHVAFCTADRVAAVRAACPGLRVIPMDGGAELGEIATRGPRIAPVAPGPDTLLTLVYTSGSTGTPKGAMFHERSWHARWRTLPFLELAALPMVSVVFLPQNHMGGRNAVANSLKLGGLACFTHAADMSTLFDDIRIVRPTYIHLVPRISELIYQHFQREAAQRSEAEVIAEMRTAFLGDRILLALTASAPTPPEVSAFVKRCFEIPIVDVFAGTEYGQLFIDRSVNRHNVLDFKLVDVPELGYLTTDAPHPRGELHVKTARAIASYFKNEEATRALRDADGFIRTGDIFEQRGPDELVWIDRRNNVLKLAQGEFVNIWKLEALFATGSRAIEQIYIHGTSTRSYLLAVIVPAGGADKAALRAELDRLAALHALAPYEVPRDFLVEPEPFSRDNGLLTSLGKPARPKLAAAYGPRLAALADRATLAAPDPDLPVDDGIPRAVAAILGLADAVDPARTFRSFGGDSIAAAALCAFVQRAYGVTLSAGFVLGPETALADVCREVVARAGQHRMFDRIHGADAEVICAADLRLARFFPGLPAGDGAAQRDATQRDGTQRDASHRDASHRDVTTHRDATRIAGAPQRDATQRDATHRDPTQRDATHRDATQCDATRVTDAPQRDATHCGATQRDATQRDATQRDATQCDATRVTDAPQRDATQRDATRRDAAHRDATATQRDATRRDAAHRDATATQRDATQRDATQRDVTHRDGTRIGDAPHRRSHQVLLTGATGFLGRFLCDELLARGHEVTCIVRATSDADAQRRLFSVLPRLAERAGLHIVAGDLERPQLGLGDERYRELVGAVETVVHAAAHVNHALGYAELFEPNVLATAHVLRFALDANAAAVNIVSTNSVSLALLGDRAHALETDDTRALGDRWPIAGRHANGYQLGKWASEVLAQDLAESHGIAVNVFRSNLILPPARTRGQINPDDFLTRLVCSVAATGLCPATFYDGSGPPHLDGFPADFIAAAIAALGTAPARGYHVFHVNNVDWADGISLDSVMRRLDAAGYRIARIADHGEWFARFERALRERPAHGSSLPIIEQWRAPLATAKRQRIDASSFHTTVRELGLAIPKLDDAYFDRCIADMLGAS